MLYPLSILTFDTMIGYFPSFRKSTLIGIHPFNGPAFKALRTCATKGGPFLSCLLSCHCHSKAINPGNATNTAHAARTQSFQSISRLHLSYGSLPNVRTGVHSIRQCRNNSSRNMLRVKTLVSRIADLFTNLHAPFSLCRNGAGFRLAPNCQPLLFCLGVNQHAKQNTPGLSKSKFKIRFVTPFYKSTCNNGLLTCATKFLSCATKTSGRNNE